MNIYKNNIKGFTLIDILLVSAIVSLLSSLFLFQVGEARKKADDAHMQVEAQQVSNAIALYKNDNNGRAPLTVTGQAGVMYPEPSPGTQSTSEYIETMQLLVDQGYLPEIPRSPDGVQYAYGVSEGGSDAVFAAKLKKSSSANQRSCPNPPLPEDLSSVYGTCEPTTSCQDGEVTEDGVCFSVTEEEVNQYCSCVPGTWNVVSSDQSIITDNICGQSLRCNSNPDEPPPPPPGDLLFNPFLNLKVFAQEEYTNYICAYTEDFTQSTTPSCTGASNQDHCRCI
jgi:type II secretory pathway pseudopilin PulG